MTTLTIHVEGPAASGRSTWAEFLNIMLADYAIENDFASEVKQDEHKVIVTFSPTQLIRLQQENAVTRK